MYECSIINIIINILNLKVLNFKDFMKKYDLKNDTMKETQLQRIYNYPIYPRDSKIHSDKGFVNIDNGSQGVFIILKITNHIILIVLEELLINFY